MTIDSGNLFDTIPGELSEEIFTELYRHENVTIERIVSTGQSSPESGWYDQDIHEWVIVLEGEAGITFEDHSTVHLVKGSYLNIPAHTRHRVAWTAQDTKTIWLAIHYQ